MKIGAVALVQTFAQLVALHGFEMIDEYDPEKFTLPPSNGFASPTFWRGSIASGLSAPLLVLA